MPEFISILRYIRDVLYPDIVIKHNAVKDVKINEDNINNVLDNMQSVITVANNEAQIQEISNQIIPVLDEILQADTNAQIATDKAQEANVQAGNAITASNMSYKWANNPEDVIVHDGKYSAFHWAMKASDIVGDGVINDSSESLATTYSSRKLAILFAEPISYIDGIQAELKSKVDDYEKGIANGVATLDSNGKITTSQIPDSVLGQLKYKGVWNFTYMPTATQKGQYWICSVSGNGYEVGDWAVYNGNTFDKIDNTDAVSSVAGMTGNVVLTKANVGLYNVDNTADSTKNVLSATKLQTSRNITLAGALVGTVSFDGSSDVTMNTTFGKIDDYELFIGGGSTVDGTSDINTLLATGKNVKLVGATKISGTIVIGANQVLFGSNSNEDKIYMDSASTFDIVALNGNYASIKGIGFQTLSIAPRTGGISIKVNKYEDNFIEDIKFTDQFIGIKIMRVPGNPANAGYNWEGAVKTRITGCSFNRSSTSNVNAVNIWVDGGNDTFINKVVMDNPVNSQPKAGIRITCSQATWITDSDMIHCGKGLLIDPDVTGYVTWCFFNGMACDFGSSSGVSIEPTGACTIKGLFFNNCWVSSNGGTKVGAGNGRGIYLATGSSGASIDGVLFNGGNIFNNALQGIYIDGNVNNIGIESSNIGSNGHSANENDIHIASSTSTGLTIRNNNTDIRMGFGKTSNYGIYVANILNNYVISNNNNGNLGSHYTSGMYINSPQLATNAVVIGNTNYSNYINGSTLTLTDSNGDITANKFRATSNGNGQAFQVGNDTWIGDVNVANTMRVSGLSNTEAGYIQFGNSTDGKSLGRTSTGALTWGGNALLTASGGYINGDIILCNGTNDSAGLVLNADGYNTWVNDNWNGTWRVYRGAGVTPLSIDTSDVLRSHGNKIWHEGNDGSGSGLDADLLDGLDSTAFMKTSGNSLTSAPLGYVSGLGVGGVVVQGSLKTDTVTLNKLSGRITMSPVALAGQTSVNFKLLNTYIGNNDIVVPIADWNLNPTNYRIECSALSDGACNFRITNISNATLSEAISFKFLVFKGAIS